MLTLSQNTKLKKHIALNCCQYSLGTGVVNLRSTCRKIYFVNLQLFSRSESAAVVEGRDRGGDSARRGATLEPDSRTAARRAARRSAEAEAAAFGGSRARGDRYDRSGRGPGCGAGPGRERLGERRRGGEVLASEAVISRRG